VPKGGEPAHVQPDLGDDLLGGVAADAGDLVQPVDGGPHRCPLDQSGSRAGSSVRVNPLRRGDIGDQLLDAGGEPADLAGQGTDLIQQHPGQFGVVVVEPAGERIDQGGLFDLHPASGQAGQGLWVTLPAINASIMSRTDTVSSLLAATETLINAYSSSFSSRE
jgi:hypothetical protein